MWSLGSVRVPVVAAPMAGGPSTPALVAAASAAGGFGFLAAGYLTPEGMQQQVAATRERCRDFGVNVFLPGGTTPSQAELSATRTSSALRLSATRSSCRRWLAWVRGTTTGGGRRSSSWSTTRSRS